MEFYNKVKAIETKTKLMVVAGAILFASGAGASLYYKPLKPPQEIIRINELEQKLTGEIRIKDALNQEKVKPYMDVKKELESIISGPGFDEFKRNYENSRRSRANKGILGFVMMVVSVPLLSYSANRVFDKLIDIN